MSTIMLRFIFCAVLISFLFIFSSQVRAFPNGPAQLQLITQLKIDLSTAEKALADLERMQKDHAEYYRIYQGGLFSVSLASASLSVFQYLYQPVKKSEFKMVEPRLSQREKDLFDSLSAQIETKAQSVLTDQPYIVGEETTNDFIRKTTKEMQVLEPSDVYEFTTKKDVKMLVGVSQSTAQSGDIDYFVHASLAEKPANFSRHEKMSILAATIEKADPQMLRIEAARTIGDFREQGLNTALFDVLYDAVKNQGVEKIYGHFTESNMINFSNSFSSLAQDVLANPPKEFNNSEFLTWLKTQNISKTRGMFFLENGEKIIYQEKFADELSKLKFEFFQRGLTQTHMGKIYGRLGFSKVLEIHHNGVVIVEKTHAAQSMNPSLIKIAKEEIMARVSQAKERLRAAIETLRVQKTKASYGYDVISALQNVEEEIVQLKSVRSYGFDPQYRNLGHETKEMLSGLHLGAINQHRSILDVKSSELTLLEDSPIKNSRVLLSRKVMIPAALAVVGLASAYFVFKKDQDYVEVSSKERNALQKKIHSIVQQLKSIEDTQEVLEQY